MKKNQKELVPKSLKRDEYYHDLSNPTNKAKVRQLVEFIRKGWSRRRLLDWVEDNWEVNRHTAYEWTFDAYFSLAKSYEKTVESAKAVQLERVEDILTDSLNNGDQRTALSAIDMINKLYNLYVEKKEVDVTATDFKFKFGVEND